MICRRKKLEDIGVILCTSNKRAVETALSLIGHPYVEKEKNDSSQGKDEGR